MKPILCALLPWIAASASFGQTATTPDAPPKAAESEAIQLNPFEVQADSDRSYGALNSNSITRFNVELSKLPVSADIFNEAFMKDIAATNVEDMIRMYSAGAGYEGADPGANSYDNQPTDRIGGASIRLRGLQTPLSMRDALMPVGSFGNPGSTGTGVTSNFDVERVEVIRGPQALLYGGGGAGGVINLTSKQARLGAPEFGEARFQVDQYGHKLGQFDFGTGTDKAAVRVAAINQTIAGRRVDIGGPMAGLYAQAAFLVLDKTTVRMSLEKTSFARMNNSNNSVVTGATDSRNGLLLHYLLATNQIQSSATGLSGDGPIDHGLVNWGNVDSYEGWDQSERVDDSFATISAETTWNPWLSTQISAGYNGFKADQDTAGFTFNSPSSTIGKGNGGQWTASQTPSDAEKPGRTKAIRISAVITKDLFNSRAHTETVIGGDFVRTDSANILYNYYLADSNFNLVLSPTAKPGTDARQKTALQWSLDNGPVQYPNFRPATDRVTVNVGGVPTNFVRQVSNPVTPGLISPADPLGVTLGGPSYEHTNIVNKGIYSVNNTQWLGGKLDTLAGFRLSSSYSENLNPGSAIPALSHVDKIAKSNNFSFNVGANYAVFSWLRPYVALSDSYDPPTNQTSDPYSNNPPASKALGEEAGFKLQNAAGTLSGSIALFHVDSKNEQYTITSSIQNDINPSGLNGTFGTPGNSISVDRSSRGMEATVTAAPTPNWRIRLGAALTDGQIKSNSNYNLLYNDQFYENKSGQVTYADGTVVYVPAAFNSKTLTVLPTAAGAQPLTVALLSNPSSPYYASPQPVNGQIQFVSPGGQVLALGTSPAGDPVAHGSILTGVTGLPISAQQIDPTQTPGLAVPTSITTAKAGDVTTGYPVIAANLTSLYTFSNGWAKGIKVGGTVSSSWYNRTNYYYTNGAPGPGASRTLFHMPNLTQFNLILGYEHRLGRFRFATQLNVNNLFNRYDIVLLPNGSTGWTPKGTNATFSAQPRDYVWSNTISF